MMTKWLSKKWGGFNPPNKFDWIPFLLVAIPWVALCKVGEWLNGDDHE